MTQAQKNFQACREQVLKVKEKIQSLNEEDRKRVDECISVLREFVRQGGDYGVVGLSLVYWEVAQASAIMKQMREAAPAPDNGSAG